MLQYEQGRNTQEDPPPWLWLPPQDPIALPLTVRRGFCKAREEEEQEGSGKLELPPFPEIIISGNQTDEGRRKKTCGETRKGFSAAVRTKKTVEPPRAAFSSVPPFPYSSAVHIRRRLLRSQPLFCNTSRGRTKGQRPFKSAGIMVVVDGVMSGHERGFHILYS